MLTETKLESKAFGASNHTFFDTSVLEDLNTAKKAGKKVSKALAVAGKKQKISAPKDAGSYEPSSPIGEPTLVFLSEEDEKTYARFKKEYEKFSFVNIYGTIKIVRTVERAAGGLEMEFMSHDHFEKRGQQDWCMVYDEANRRTQKLYFAKHWQETAALRQRYDKFVFNPDPQFSDPEAFNCWHGFIRPVKGDATPFLKHLELLLNCDKARLEYFINWCAYSVQFPHVAIGTVPILKGPKGSGKSLLTLETLCAMCPSHSTVVANIKDLFSFNADSTYSIFMFVEEGFAGNDNVQNNMFKHLVTGTTRRTEAKYQNAKEIKNYANVILTSNNERPIHTSGDERRLVHYECVFAGDKQYFDTYYDWVKNKDGAAIVLNYLQNVDLKGFKPNIIPDSSDLVRQKIASLNGLQRFVYQILSRDIDDPLLNEWEDVELNVNRSQLFDLYERENRFHKIDKARFSTSFGVFMNYSVVEPSWGDKWRTRVNGVITPYYKLPPRAEVFDLFAASLNTTTKLLKEAMQSPIAAKAKTGAPVAKVVAKVAKVAV